MVGEMTALGRTRGFLALSNFLLLGLKAQLNILFVGAETNYHA
jgi:hypothetical protein